MAVYSAVAIDIDDLQTLFEGNWDTKSAAVPVPKFLTTDEVRVDPSIAWESTPVVGAVNIMMEDITEDQMGYAYEFVNQRATVTLDIWTRRDTASAGGTGRQYMHDVKQELRRIIFVNKHSLNNWQIMKYQSFREIYEDSVGETTGTGRFHGQIRIQLENDAIRIPTELVSEDDFDRANAAIGSDWTNITGTWNVDTNKAALASATASARTTYTPSGITFKKNQRVQVDITVANAADVGIVFRYTDASNYWYANLIETGGIKFLRLHSVVASSDVQEAEIREPGWADDDIVELAIDLCNDGIAVQYNGLATIQIVSTKLNTAAVYGMWSNNDQNSRFDNYAIFETSGAGR